MARTITAEDIFNLAVTYVQEENKARAEGNWGDFQAARRTGNHLIRRYARTAGFDIETATRLIETEAQLG